LKRWVVLTCATLLGVGVPICFGALTGSLTEKAIIERIKPEGQVTIQGGVAGSKATSPVASADIGKDRYEQTCQMCHQAGLADAPKLGDKKAWQPRIAQGMDKLVKHAMEGLKAMPPKGGCSTCDEAEIRKTIEYMVSKVK